MSLEKNLKLLREARGIDQYQLAKISGIPSGTISALEVRNSKKSHFAPQLAQALGICLAELFGADATSNEGAAPPVQPIEVENNPNYPAIRRVRFKLRRGVQDLVWTTTTRTACP